ncbi:MAG TPA: transcription antitermination factor NusB [Acidimicrobiales bacterium]|nr:transcription antitermination factor NusB [Acidimicrobiales bacterium]
MTGPDDQRRPDQRRPGPRARPAPAGRGAGRGTPARRVALEAMVAIAGGARANVEVPARLTRSGLDERDRGLVTELVYGATRMRRACDWLVDRHVRGRTDDEVRAALRLGAYQLAYLDTPPHAAVGSTVDAVAGPGRSLVNAVLRRAAADLARGRPRWPDPATELSYPDWIVARLARDLGPGPARAALETMNQAAAATRRHDGYTQDLASQWVAAAVGAQPGDRVVDLCAAPGGKATAMAHAGPRVVVAADIDPARAAVVAANAATVGTANVATVVADAAAPPLRPGCADRVLVDAPCSGLGVLRRRPDARWRVQPGDVDRLARLACRLLDAAVPLLRPGGTLVYSVCTLTAAETAGVDHWLATAHPELEPLPPPDGPWQPAGRGALLLPQAAGTDGMFLLRVRTPD